MCHLHHLLLHLAKFLVDRNQVDEFLVFDDIVVFDGYIFGIFPDLTDFFLRVFVVRFPSVWRGDTDAVSLLLPCRHWDGNGFWAKTRKESFLIFSTIEGRQSGWFVV